MTDRRAFMAMCAAATIAPRLAACAGVPDGEYDAATSTLRNPLPTTPQFASLVRFATLAPNGHNTQPWRFAELATGARILPDLTRRTPIVDPDDHHLWISLGCAAENFLVASAAAGRPGAMTYMNEGSGYIDLDLAQGTARVTPLFRAITSRQSTRSLYDGRMVAAEHLALLEVAARTEGVALTVITDPRRCEAITHFVERGNDAQMDDPRFVRELRDWIRFNSEAAITTGDGLFSGCTGNPALPSWFGRRFFGMIFTKDAEDKKYAAQMRSSAGVAVFVGDQADKDHWTRVGRSFQRFALQATALGIRHCMINQPVEVPAVRAEFARWLGIGDQRPDLVVRFGHALPMPMSMRRPPPAVIVTA